MRLCVVLALISMVTSMPRKGPQEDTPSKDAPEDMEMLDEDEMKQLLTDLFISHPTGPRDARQLEGDADEALENEEPAAAKDDSEAQASEEEVARFNNYIDAIYRRMNAALRAKMMDPMTLNLDDKQKKARKPNKPRSLGKREADDEDEDEYDDQTALDEDEDEDDD